ncbi:telomerase-binding protein EST1A [Caerostris extrusa]|uniref:Telomerase-binding protein EST1A n=1 Tax=Caerostris extrusa TaxID=172846 RepID=A0AAV4V3I3_CAEEX|nr:telomerase-binding protein EST1A [Caerostris extrusa]
MLEVENISGIIIPDYLKCLLISVQKVLIYLGDLSRYKEQLTQSPNYGKARSYYLKAQQIAPKNGKPYNQLAILACFTRQSLLALFEEAKKRYEAYDKTRPKENDYTEEDDSGRCEIWIKPDGSSNHHSVYSSELANLSDMDINKRFIISFLHVHGKLFTKVGMENFSEVLNIMVQEFENLLQRSPLLLTTGRLQQLIAVNIFSVMKSLKKGYEHEDRSLFQEQAVYTFMVIMSLLMERCVYLINIFTPNPEEPNKKLFVRNLLQFYQLLKYGLIGCHVKNLSTMTVFSKSLNIRSNKDVWTSFC